MSSKRVVIRCDLRAATVDGWIVGLVLGVCVTGLLSVLLQLGSPFSGRALLATTIAAPILGLVISYLFPVVLTDHGVTWMWAVVPTKRSVAWTEIHGVRRRRVLLSEWIVLSSSSGAIWLPLPTARSPEFVRAVTDLAPPDHVLQRTLATMTGSG